MTTFANLSPEMQAKAIEITRDRENNCGDNNFAEFVIGDLKEECENIGIGDVEARWDVSYCQGSGASFVSNHFDDLEKVMRHFKIWSKYRMLHDHIRIKNIEAMLVSTCHRYNHYNTVGLECEIDYYADRTDKQEAKCEELQEELLELLRERMRVLHRDLEAAYENTQTDEYIKELIEANDWEFETCEYETLEFM